MANFALNYSFSRNLPIPLDEDAVKATLAEVDEYVKTKGKCYEGQLFSVTGETGDNVVKNGLYIALSKGENGQVIKLASQDALDAVAASAGKIDKIQLNGTELTINDKVVNIDLSTYATIDYVNGQISELSGVYAPKADFEEVKKKVEDITSTGGEPNVQSDWNVNDSESDAYIKNKAVGSKTNQEGRIINLSDKCSGIVLPNLHIDENDVEASHSCSVGSVNQDHLYYLETRGLTPLQARNILIRGYFNPILENIENEKIKEEIIEILQQRIG
jgi:hypothetical protein